MTNAPTKSAIPPKTSSAVRTNPNSSCRSAVRWSASWTPVRTSTGRSARAAVTLARRRAGVTPSRAAIEIELTSPGRPMSACALGSVTIAAGKPLTVSALPNRALPTSLNRRRPSLPTTVTLSPSAKPESAKALADSASSPGACGARPLTKTNGSSGLGCTAMTKFTLPPMRSPCASRIDTSSLMAPAAAATPSTLRTRSTSASGNGGGDSSKASSTFLGETTTSVPELACWKVSEKDLSMVSVST
jgi:hypothetical protein